MVLHWYNEILVISHYLGIAICKSECVAAAATAKATTAPIRATATVTTATPTATTQ